MSTIGFVGLGKLGLPVALAVESKGHKVVGYDINPLVKSYVSDRKIPYKEEGAQPLLDKTNLNVTTLTEVVDQSDIIFVPIQTPHDPAYEGVTRIPDKRVDFDYTWLKTGLLQLDTECERQNVTKTVVIISTVLPGTLEPIIAGMSEHCRVCYNPFFIAMGTTIRDFTNPEFVLLGQSNPVAELELKMFYSTIHDRPVHSVGIPEAELTKVAYNTFISTKLSFVNTLMEICHKTGINVDDVTDGLKLANQRLISPAYLTAGMADGGGCHPRDNIAMSYLAGKLRLSYDFFDAIMTQRENSTEWLADGVIAKSNYHENHSAMKRLLGEPDETLPIHILGKAFKAETNLTVGSPAVLLKNLIEDRTDIKVVHWDPHVDIQEHTGRLKVPDWKIGVYFIGTKHEVFKNFKFPKGSIVFDPWRYLVHLKDEDGIEYIPIGGPA
jgi:UDPglucose 6-dehydrogenase